MIHFNESSTRDDVARHLLELQLGASPLFERRDVSNVHPNETTDKEVRGYGEWRPYDEIDQDIFDSIEDQLFAELHNNNHKENVVNNNVDSVENEENTDVDNQNDRMDDDKSNDTDWWRLII